MFRSGGTPFFSTKKISPSVSPCAHSASVRSGDGGAMSLPVPPSAAMPWQAAQLRV
jgi:hypothetical protein